MIIVLQFHGTAVSEEIASVMLQSCQKAMPNVEIWQLTDEKTKQLDGVTGCIRRPYKDDFVVFFFEHMINLPKGEILKLDYDMIINRDVSDVFRLPFDIALTRRPLNDPTCSNLLRVKNPHNHGTMFIRNGKPFFQYAYEDYLNNPYKDGWLDCATSLENAAASNVCRWIELPGERYNYTPKKREEDVSYCSIVHYKGGRKHWMVGKDEEERAKQDGDSVLRRVESGSYGAKPEI